MKACTNLTLNPDLALYFLCWLFQPNLIRCHIWSTKTQGAEYAEEKWWWNIIFTKLIFHLHISVHCLRKEKYKAWDDCVILGRIWHFFPVCSYILNKRCIVITAEMFCTSWEGSAGGAEGGCGRPGVGPQLEDVRRWQQFQRGTEAAGLPRPSHCAQQQGAGSGRGHSQRRPQVSRHPSVYLFFFFFSVRHTILAFALQNGMWIEGV